MHEKSIATPFGSKTISIDSEDSRMRNLDVVKAIIMSICKI